MYIITIFFHILIIIDFKFNYYNYNLLGNYYMQIEH